MKRSDLIDWENTMMKEVVRRRQLGGYSPDAEGLLLLSEAMMRLFQHIIERHEEPTPDIEVQIKEVKAQRKLEGLKRSSK